MKRLNRNIAKLISPRKAFTLMEVVIALAIASISLLALLKLHLVSTVLADTAELSTQAVLLANGKIEESLANGFPNIGMDRGTVQNGGISFQWQREVAEETFAGFGEQDIKGLRKISVNLNWKRGNTNKHLEMFAYVADRTLK